MYDQVATVVIRRNLTDWLNEEIDCPSMLGDFEPGKTPRLARLVELSMVGLEGSGHGIRTGGGYYGRQDLTAEEREEVQGYITVVDAAKMLSGMPDVINKWIGDLCEAEHERFTAWAEQQRKESEAGVSSD